MKYVRKEICKTTGMHTCQGRFSGIQDPWSTWRSHTCVSSRGRGAEPSTSTKVSWNDIYFWQIYIPVPASPHHCSLRLKLNLQSMVSHSPSMAVTLHSRTKHFLVATLGFLKIKFNYYFNPIYPKYFNINHNLKFLLCVLPACMNVHQSTKSLWGTGKRNQSSRTGVTEGCKLPCGC